jgi:hypothetical protein
MTDDLKRTQKAMALLECSEAEQDLSHLEFRASEVGKALASIGRWVNALVSPLQGDSTGYNYKKIEVQGNEYDSNTSVISEAMNHAALISLIQELRDARYKVHNLKSRKQKLGVT